MMKFKEEAPQTKSPSRVWLVLKKPIRYFYHYMIVPCFKPPNPQSLFSSLPDEIVVNCLARISRSYYPKLSLVSKTFRSLILSNELYAARFHLKTTEDFFHVCLQLPHHHRPTWFTLLIKPDQTLTNDLEKKQNPTGNTLLVRIPFSPYSPHVPLFTVRVGSEYYALEQNFAPSCIMWVRNKDIFFWREAPRMTVARVNAVAAVLDGKIYVMGGCGADQSTNWAEAFDTKTQTWESLPDPGPEIRFSKIKTIEVMQGKLYVISNKFDYVYDPKKGKWDIERQRFVNCEIENVCYGCDENSCLWYDTRRKRWRVIRGLAMLNRNRCGNFVEIANYHGKLLILWDKFKRQGPYKNIWCAVIALERRNDDDEVWGNIEWANVVLTVPSFYVFLRSRLTSF